MDVKEIAMIRQPRPKVWFCLRDRLPELAKSLDGIESIVTTAREVDAQEVCAITNVWSVRPGIASLLNVTSDAPISWTDKSRWFNDTFETQWEVTPNFLGGRLVCRGTTQYHEAMGGSGTRVVLEMSAELLPDLVNNSANSPEQGIISAAQSIAATVICKNFRRLLDVVDVRLREVTDASSIKG